MTSTSFSRDVLRSLRIAGATAAVAAGIAGFATVASPEASVVVVEAGASQRACDKASDRALERAVGLASCTPVVVDPVFGDPIIDPIFGSPTRGPR